MTRLPGGSSLRESVRNHFAGIAAAAGAGVLRDRQGLPAPLPLSDAASLGYSAQELESLPDGAYMGLGCGNPVALADLRQGATVVDLGSGGGIDCFLASPRVGPHGTVIGIDMGIEMVRNARAYARSGGYSNVEFLLALMERLPLAGRSVDVVISNCTVNLSPEKELVFGEAFRVLKQNGRLALTDIVAIRRLPSGLRDNLNAYCGCIGGAVSARKNRQLLRDAGFTNVSVDMKPESARLIATWFPGSGFEEYVRAATITAVKPPAA
jgi:arsenite methyltransferase